MYYELQIFKINDQIVTEVISIGHDKDIGDLAARYVTDNGIYAAALLEYDGDDTDPCMGWLYENGSTHTIGRATDIQKGD